MKDIDQATVSSMQVVREFLQATYENKPEHAKWLEDQVDEGGSISVLIDLLPFTRYRVVLIKGEAVLELATAEITLPNKATH